jgi:ABC-type microcin C transport system permease subunit YejE
MDMTFIFSLILFGCSYLVGYYFGRRQGYFTGAKELFEELLRRESAQPVIDEMWEEYFGE